jgi:hypothetical protein
MMLVGVGTVVAWGMTPWAGAVFKALPGMLAPLLVYGAARATGLARGAERAS